jgi:hypothetical protein
MTNKGLGEVIAGSKGSNQDGLLGRGIWPDISTMAIQDHVVRSSGVDGLHVRARYKFVQV